MPDKLHDSFFRAVFEAPALGMAVVDLQSHCVVRANRRLLDIVGRRREEVEAIPFVLRDITPAEFLPQAEHALAEVAAIGWSEAFEAAFVRPDGTRVPVRASFSGVPDYPHRMIVFVDDVTKEHSAREREKEIQQRLEIALSAAEQGVWEYDLVSGEMIYSARAKEIYGLPVDLPVTFRQISEATHPDDYPNTSAQLMRAIDPAIRDRSSYEYRIVRPDGSICWALAFGEAVFEGEPGAERATRYIGTIQDITPRKEAERHQILLVRELNHRVKNTLAIVQALAFQSFQDLPEEVGDAFAGRLQALAMVHDILTASAWETAKLRELAAAVLHPYDDGGGRIAIAGEDVPLTPQFAVNLAIALNELATNAAKYGALRSPSGRVELGWTLADGDPARLRIAWRERGGPPTEAPGREGFGTRLVKRLVAWELGGSVQLDFDEGGARCLIEAPLCAPNGNGGLAPAPKAEPPLA
ncbi:MAG TPA: HWE histidine kinase domain-containing protein [Allosphingosinicella sp.]|nr:HWE histidine kinase domain-containing protein [Allosphingosinicella sp.]